MESVGKSVVTKAQDARQFIPSIVRPTELSRRPDSSNSDLEKPGKTGRSVTAEKLKGTLVDTKLVDEAVGWISAKVAATLRRGAEDVGEYVLDMFFSSDPELAKSRNPQKNASYRALAERCATSELPVSKTWLNNAVGIAVMLRRLPGTARAFRQLPPSYQETLLPLRDPSRVEEVANKVSTKDLSYRELRKVVAEERAKTPKVDARGRPPTPAIVKALNRSLKSFAFEGNRRAFSKADVDALDEQERKRALKCAEGMIEQLRDLVRKLRKT
ncbi:MAG: hypothetical protein JXQ75_01135 [Phycisphaerae bacterium]|nr:hypothetical protein [Phycisphaerae bacterium]